MPFPRATVVRFAAALVCVVVLAGCATTASPSSWRDRLADQIRGRGLDPATVMAPFALDASIRAWGRSAIEGRSDDEQKVRALLGRLVDPQALHLSYVWGYTATAMEVFARGEANCLAFTNLFVSLARDLDLDVGFLLVRDSESFRKEGDLVVISDHVAAGLGHGPSRLVIDLAPQPHRSARRIEAISDLTALALFHSNRGAELLQDGDPAAALDWLETAIALDGEQAGSWVNYGVALRRSDRAAGAEAAYRRALEIDPRTSSAATNLASLLRRLGRIAEARAFEEALGARPGRNPYTYLALADVSRANGHLEEASRLYRRAMSLNPDDAEAFAALGLLAVEVGDEKAAKRLLVRARRRDPQHPRTLALADQLEGRN